MNIYDYIKASESFSDNYKIIPLPELRQYYFKSDIYEFNKVARKRRNAFSICRATTIILRNMPP